MTAGGMKFDVVVVGNVGIDTNVFHPQGSIDWNIESNFTENLDYVGQAGGFSARGFAQLGYRTAFIGYVGDDFLGKYILSEFASDGINTDGIFIDPAGTGRSINLVFADGSRKNFYDGKSHLVLEPDLDLCRSLIAGARLVHFSIPNWARSLLPLAEEAGAVISCDLQDIVSVDDLYRRDFIHYADILFFSNVNQGSPEEVIKTILARYPEKIIISGMGKDGCTLGTSEGISFFKAVELDSEIVDTTGAGDGLAVGFTASYCLEGSTLQEAVRQGQITARYTCGLKADTAKLISREILDRLNQEV
jgi:sugar/nucleoside kinase (ribokinase family)